MTNLILHYYDYINGAFTSMCDLHNNTGLPMKIITPYPVEVTYFDFKCNSFFGMKNVLSKLSFGQIIFEADNIICSAKLLKDINEGNVQIACTNLIIIDSFDIAKSYYGLIENIEKAVHHCTNTTILSNPANFHKIFYQTVEYYHKFSKQRLDTLPTISGVKNYTRNTKPHIRISPTSYFENIGKGIFEFIYRGGTVNYIPDGMNEKDGLYYYLRLFGLDGEQTYTPLPLTKNDIEDKLLMKDDDLIFKLTGA